MKMAVMMVMMMMMMMMVMGGDDGDDEGGDDDGGEFMLNKEDEFMHCRHESMSFTPTFQGNRASSFYVLSWH